MTVTDEFAEALDSINSDSLAALRAVMTLARDLGPGKSTAFLRDCLDAVDASLLERAALPVLEVLAPVLARWAGQVQS